jgi:hypothetical protein
MLTNQVWRKYMNDPQVLYYFPDKFLKSVPSKQYFWQVFSKIKPIEYENFIDLATKRVVQMKKFTRNTIKVTEEALEVFKDFSNEDLDLLSDIK